MVWYAFDIIGTIAFAISGALVGVSRKMDIFGIIVLAMATAIGGGITRDIMAGHFPPNSLRDSTYITIIVIVCALVFLIYHQRVNYALAGPRSKAIYLLADAVGLASFTITGASIGLQTYPQSPVFVVMLGTITAVGGGMIRDVLGGRIPSVLREEVYALPTIIGGSLYYALTTHGYPLEAMYATFIVVLGIRILALYYHWDLPRVR